MRTRSQNSKAAFRAANAEFKLLNQKVKELEKEVKNHQREKEQNRKNAIINDFITIMRANGASQQSIQKAFPGLAEFAKYAVRSSDKDNIALVKHPQSTPASAKEAPAPAKEASTPAEEALAPTEEALSMSLTEVETQEIRWLWEQRVPLGKVTILDGDPDMGKSLLAINLAARVSTGQPMPDGTVGTQGGVILIAPEDGAGDTLRPRLEAAGGDPSHVHLLNLLEDLDAKKLQVTDRPFSLSLDLEVLEAEINRTKAVLVVVDPLTAVLGHQSREQDVREVFTPLAQLAECTSCAILIIRHLGKGSSPNALYRGAGSIGIIAAARAGLIVTRHPNEQHTRILATTKNNLGRTASNLTYQVVQNESGIPCIQWLGENDDSLSALLEDETNLSSERHKILQALENAEGPLGPQEIAELTGQKETLVRVTLSRMHEAREIARPYRGKYTTPTHPSLLQKSMDSALKPPDTTDTLATSDTTDTTDTTDTLDKIFPHFAIVSSNGRH